MAELSMRNPIAGVAKRISASLKRKEPPAPRAGLDIEGRFRHHWSQAVPREQARDGPSEVVISANPSRSAAVRSSASAAKGASRHRDDSEDDLGRARSIDRACRLRSASWGQGTRPIYRVGAARIQHLGDRQATLSGWVLRCCDNGGARRSRLIPLTASQSLPLHRKTRGSQSGGPNQRRRFRVIRWHRGSCRWFSTSSPTAWHR